MGTKLHFVLLHLCLPAVLAYPSPAGEVVKDEDRTEGINDKDRQGGGGGGGGGR